MEQIPTAVTIINSGLIGYQGISLTNFSTSTLSAIAQGSKCEIAGSFFKAAGDENIDASSWAAITTGTTAYIALTPSGTAGSQIVEASYTADAPIWSTSKQGWYSSAGSSIRIIGSVYKDSNTQQSKKVILSPRKNVNWDEVLSSEIDSSWATLFNSEIDSSWASALTALSNTQTTHGLDLAAGSAGTYGDQVLDGDTSWIIPAGLYMMAGQTPGMSIQIKTGASWHGYTQAGLGGLVLSDGVNFRVYVVAGAQGRVYYRKIL